MTRLQRIAQQRARMQEAMGILRGICELFGAEDNPTDDGVLDVNAWDEKLQEFSDWVWNESPIA